jgi:Beta propeller domain
MLDSFESRCNSQSRRPSGMKSNFAIRLIASCALFMWAGGLLSGCGGGGSGPGSLPTDVAPPASPIALRATTEAGLMAYFSEALGPTSVPYVTSSFAVDVMAAARDVNLGVPAANASTSAGVAAISGTTLQEAGVDEADLIKSDGSQVFSLEPAGAKGTAGDVLRRQKLSTSQPALTPVDTLMVPMSTDVRATEMYLDSDRQQVAVLGQGYRNWNSYDMWFAPQAWSSGVTELALISTANASAMQKNRTLRITANLIGSRRIGATLYLVLRSYPQLPGLDPAWPAAKAASNQAIVNGAQPAQLLPTLSIDGENAQPLVDASACFVQDNNSVKSADVITVVGIDLAAGTHRHGARCFTGGTEAFYMSEANLYLATTRMAYNYSALSPVYGTQTSTDIHQFALNVLNIAYQGSGSVDGHLGWDQKRKSYRMGEYQGTLRVVTQTGTAWGGWVGTPMPVVASTAVFAAADSPAKLTLLQAKAGILVNVGELPNAKRPAPLGKPGEQIYATRFLGNRGYLVTYRLTDPLYVLDLSNPTDPQVAGELHVEGYSDYLFPLSESLLLGVGKDAVVDGTPGDGRAAWYQGVKVSLIDVSDPTKPVEAARSIIGKRGTDAAVLRDPHGIAVQTTASGVRVSLPVSLNDTTPFGPSGAPTDYYQFTRVELQKLEVNVSAKTLTVRAPMAASVPGPRDISKDRSLLWNDQVHYYQDGVWQSAGW